MCTALVPDITEMRTTIYKIYENLWIKLTENVNCPKTFGGGKKVSNVALQIHTYQVVYAQTDRRV